MAQAEGTHIGYIICTYMCYNITCIPEACVLNVYRYIIHPPRSRPPTPIQTHDPPTDLIRKYFGHLEAGADTAASRQALTLKLQSRHFPPVTHNWSGGRFDKYAGAALPATLKDMGKVEEGEHAALRPRIFQHENIQVGRCFFVFCFFLIFF